MDVFAIPVEADQYELYYEHSSEPEPDVDDTSTGFLGPIQRRFSQLLREAEEQDGRRPRPDAPKGIAGRMQAWLMSWIAERIAEQRLLWRLRKRTEAVVVHPGDVAFDDVVGEVRRMLQRDYERHRFWLVIDAIGMTLAALISFIPGPNLLAYYFVFRVGGHWLSMRGAAQGIHRVAWTGQPSAALATLRGVWSLGPRARRQRVREVAEELRLPKLPRFFDRVVRRKAGHHRPDAETPGAGQTG